MRARATLLSHPQFTMVGEMGSATHRGVVPRALEDLFSALAALRQSEGWEWETKVRAVVL